MSALRPGADVAIRPLADIRAGQLCIFSPGRYWKPIAGREAKMALWEDALAQHYKVNWGQIGEVCPFAAGPVQQLPVDFQVLRFKPTATRHVWTYATVGMSQPHEPNGIELHVFAPEATPSIVELLYVTAHFHRTASRLGLGHSVNFGRPWLPGS